MHQNPILGGILAISSLIILASAIQQNRTGRSLPGMFAESIGAGFLIGAMAAGELLHERLQFDGIRIPAMILTALWLVYRAVLRLRRDAA